MSGWKKPASVLILCCFASGVGFWFGRDSRPPVVNSESAPDEPQSATVQTKRVIWSSMIEKTEAYGTVQPTAGSTTSLSLQFDAEIQNVRVAQGVTVTADTPVAEVGPTAEAQLLFKQAQDASAAADRNVLQVRQRLSEQLATNVDLSSAEQSQIAAKTQLENLIKRGIDSSKIICAGKAGMVTQINVQVGQVVAAGTPILVLSAQGDNEAIVGVEPELSSRLKVGDKIDLRSVRSDKDSTFVPSAIQRISQQINPQTRLCEIALPLPPDVGLTSGSFVVAEIPTAAAEGLLVPRAAAIPDDEDQIVYTVSDGKAKRHVVILGLRNNEQAQVISDELHVGDSVVTVGNLELEDGMTVTVSPDSTEQPATAPSAEDK